MNHRFPKDLSSLALHFIAMGLMLCDHLWATIIPGNDWLTWLGRMAFPIFAFLLVEGYCHTRSFRNYLGRMAVFALVSELPFNLMYTGGWIFPFHQNVLWSFVLGLLCMRALDGAKKRSLWLRYPLGALTVLLFWLAAQLLMVDYYGWSLLTIVVFYLFRGRSWWQRLGQGAGLIAINWIWMGSQTMPVALPGFTLEIPQQGMAVLALLPIWAYRGRQGLKSKGVQAFCYGFYPAHMLILGLLSR